MAIRIIQLGTPRVVDEGPRIGTVRRPPRGIPKDEFAKRNYYDVWFPMLSPSAELVAEAKAAESADDWAAFRRKFTREMAAPDAARTLDLLALLSDSSNFAIGCYCTDESRCHRGVLRELLLQRRAKIAN